LQWLLEPVLFIQQLKRILGQGGQFALALPVHGTLFEVEQAWRAVDDQAHINRFYSAEYWLTLLQAHGFMISRQQQQDFFNIIKALKSY